eukprot:533195-Pleurochrysis_carterae.AAC.1
MAAWRALKRAVDEAPVLGGVVVSNVSFLRASRTRCLRTALTLQSRRRGFVSHAGLISVDPAICMPLHL